MMDLPLKSKNMKTTKNKRGGRPPKDDPATKRFMVNFNNEEYLQFLSMHEESGVKSISAFIKARVFNETFKVIKVDRSTMDYYQKLSALYAQYRGVANNYNQIVVALRSNFTEKKAMVFLYKLESATKEMVLLFQKIITLTEEYRKEWSQKSQ